MDISTRDRIEGCLFAGACGDAMGVPFEFSSLLDMIIESGPHGVAEFWCRNEHPGLVSDETQIVLFACAALVAARYDRSLTELQHLHRAYRAWASTQDPSFTRHNAEQFSELCRVVRSQGDRCADSAMIQGLGDGREAGNPASNANQSNSAVARVAPIGLVYMADPVRAYNIAVADAQLTHGHPRGYVPAGAFAMLIALLSRGSHMAKAVERVLAHLKTQPDHHETYNAIMEAPWPTKHRLARPTWWGWGWTGDEALAIAVNAVMTTDNLQSALIVAASHDGDSDTTASMAGNLAGTLYGVRSIPPRWLQTLEMRKELKSAAHGLCRIIPECGRCRI